MALSDPVEETPTQAIERLRREIADLRRLRASLPAMILKPYADEALAHIRDIAVQTAVPPEIPVVPAEVPPPGSAVTISAPPEDLEAIKPCMGVKAGDPAWDACKRFDFNFDGVVDAKDLMLLSRGAAGVVVSAAPTGHSSPPEYEVMVLTSTGRIVRVKASEVQLAGSPVAAAAVSTPTASFSSGQRVRDRSTGKMGYIVEVADGKVQVALDEGGFITRAIADVEVV